MQAEIDIRFDQLVQLVKRLSAGQWKRLKNEVEKKQPRPVSDIEKILLNAPTFSKKQLQEIDNARKKISQWRKE